MITVRDIIGKPIAVLSSDGLKLYTAIVENLSDEKEIEINFDGLDQVTSAFLNGSIGKIWMNSPDFANSFRFSGASASLQQRIDMVKENALNKDKSQLRDEVIREYLEEV